MDWLIIAIFAYLILAVVSLLDKYLISGPIPNPKVYAFYVGAFGLLSIFLIPFGFSIPGFLDIFIALLAGAIYVFAILGLYTGLQLFETSRVVSAIGGILPLFTFGLTYIFSGGEASLGIFQVLAFLFLISGSVLITFDKEKNISLKSLKITIPTAFLFSLSFVLSKFVYLAQPFLSGFIWMRIGGFLAALLLFFSKEVKEELFKKRDSFKIRTGGVFLLNQALGAAGFVLQSWSVALVPFYFLPFINALEGTKYVFLLILTTGISLTNPFFAQRVGIKEEFSKKILLQKIISVLLIGLGLGFLSFGGLI